MLILFIFICSLTYPATIYVNKDATSPYNGSSWEHGYQTIQMGIDSANASDDVWVKKGLYIESITLKSNVNLYGGFSGTETSLDQCDPLHNLTIIDGNKGSAAVVGANYSTIEGFIITNAAIGVNCDGKAPTISRSRIQYNVIGINCNNSTPKIINNVIRCNENNIYCTSSGRPEVFHNIITQANQGISLSGGSGVIIKNNIISNNIDGVYNGTATVMNNCFWENNYNTPYVSGTITGNIFEEPLYVTEALFDFHLHQDSPCINRGATDVGITIDYDGEARPYGGSPDIGPDEWRNTTFVQPDPLPSNKIIYVKKNATGNNDGTSWEDAFTDILGGIGSAQPGNEIWVAADTYIRDIYLKSWVSLYGGFNGGETSRTQRQPLVYKTIIDGNGSGLVVEAVNNSYIDGFTIRNGTTGVQCPQYGSATVQNCKIESNSSYGVYCDKSMPLLINNIIKGNANSGIYCTSNGRVNTFHNVITQSNRGISLSGGSGAIIINNIISNSTDGIYNGVATVMNNCFWGNGNNLPYVSGTQKNNLNSDPKFVSADNYHLQENSDCIDSGAVIGINFDFELQGRPYGNGFDIGPDERLQHPGVNNWSLWE